MFKILLFTNSRKNLTMQFFIFILDVVNLQTGLFVSRRLAAEFARLGGGVPGARDALTRLEAVRQTNRARALLKNKISLEPNLKRCGFEKVVPP